MVKGTSKGKPYDELPLSEAQISRTKDKSKAKAQNSWSLFLRCPAHKTDPDHIYDFRFKNKVDVAVWYRKILRSMYYTEGKHYDLTTMDTELNDLIPSGPHEWMTNNSSWVREVASQRSYSYDGPATNIVDNTLPTLSPSRGGGDTRYWNAYELGSIRCPTAWVVLNLDAPHAVSAFRYWATNDKYAPKDCKLWCCDQNWKPSTEEGWSLCAEWVGDQRMGWSDPIKLIHGTRVARYWKFEILSTYDDGSGLLGLGIIPDAAGIIATSGPRIYQVQLRGTSCDLMRDDLRKAMEAGMTVSDLNGQIDYDQDGIMDREDELGQDLIDMQHAHQSHEQMNMAVSYGCELPSIRPHKEYEPVDQEGCIIKAAATLEKSERFIKRILEDAGDEVVIVQTSMQMRKVLS